MAIVLTSQAALRQRILAVLSSTESGSLPPGEALDRMYAQFTWTDDDVFPPPSQMLPPRWRTRASIERNLMADDGLIDRIDVRDWKLTPEGWAAAKIEAPKARFRQLELVRREKLWETLVARGGPNDVPRGLLRELQIYGNQAGIFVPSAATRTPGTPKGVALSFLHTGRHYEDELTETGVIYHYPTTGRSGHDESEIAASKAAWEAALPVFVIGPGSKATTRTVHRGYIEDVDDGNRVLLITFTRAQIPPRPTKDEQIDQFNLTDDESDATYSQVRNRPNQVRFAFDVFKRYGAGCAVCPVSVAGLVQAAHLLAKSKQGTDDARNGLPLCANHHLAFDRGYWCLDPNTGVHGRAEGPTPLELGVVRPNLTHLPQAPHPAALAAVWAAWQKSQKIATDGTR